MVKFPGAISTEILNYLDILLANPLLKKEFPRIDLESENSSHGTESLIISSKNSTAYTWLSHMFKSSNTQIETNEVWWSQTLIKQWSGFY